MKTIILDTNFLLIPGQFGLDIFEEISRIAPFRYELAIVDKTLDELETIIENGNHRDRTAAKMAKQLIRSKEIAVIPTKQQGHTDDLIVDLLDDDSVLATQDKGLKSRVNVPIITMRQKKYLYME